MNLRKDHYRTRESERVAVWLTPVRRRRDVRGTPFGVLRSRAEIAPRRFCRRSGGRRRPCVLGGAVVKTSGNFLSGTCVGEGWRPRGATVYPARTAVCELGARVRFKESFAGALSCVRLLSRDDDRVPPTSRVRSTARQAVLCPSSIYFVQAKTRRCRVAGACERNVRDNTPSGGSLGSCVDEERSQLRDLM